MTTIRDRVIALWHENQSISVADLRILLPDVKSQTLTNYLSEARKLSTPFTVITEAETEKVILSLLNKKVDKVTVRMMIDFLKIKRADDGMEQDLDFSKFLKVIDEAHNGKS